MRLRTQLPQVAVLQVAVRRVDLQVHHVGHRVHHRVDQAARAVGRVLLLAGHRVHRVDHQVAHLRAVDLHPVHVGQVAQAAGLVPVVHVPRVLHAGQAAVLAQVVLQVADQVRQAAARQVRNRVVVRVGQVHRVQDRQVLRAVGVRAHLLQAHADPVLHLVAAHYNVRRFYV